MREDKEDCNYLRSEYKDGARLFSEVQGGMTGDNSTCCNMGYSNQALTKISPPLTVVKQLAHVAQRD